MKKKITIKFELIIFKSKLKSDNAIDILLYEFENLGFKAAVHVSKYP